MSIRVFDAHCDTAFELWYRKESLAKNSCHIDLEKAAIFSAYAQVFAFCSLSGYPLDAPMTTQNLLKLPLQKLRSEVDANREHIAFARSVDEVGALGATGKTAALLSIEGPEVIDCDPNALESLREQGFVMTTLTWNADNILAGWHGSGNGLTNAGRDFVRQAEQVGMAIDVSHLSEAAFWDLTRTARKPILASHSNCRALCDVSRNLTDDQLRAIRDCGGVVGLNLYTEFLGENADFTTLLRHLEHTMDICGENAAILGGDLDGCDTLPKGFSHVGSYVDFYRFLSARGYDETLLDRIFYDNFLQFLKREAN